MLGDLFSALSSGSAGYGAMFLSGMAVTLAVAVSSLVTALLFGVLVGLAACSNRFLARAFWRFYRSVFSSIPTLLVLFFIYFGIPYIASRAFAFDVEVSPFVAGLCGLTLIYATYVAEVLRGAVFAVPKGQYEACEALGLTRWPSWLGVIAPQVARIALPGLINTWVALLKDTALVSVIGIADVVRVGMIAGSSTGRPLYYLGIAGFFFVAIVSVSLALLTALRIHRTRSAGGVA
ncbi:ABC transporter permease subunit [Paraburkholderia sp. MM6662-R1]|uniref:ABC transporter permease subunit n=1 Tax=Paraburkholderia sp. MM6662-R1 TaxID=2991066 RepID=UPI003D1F99B2